MVAPSGDQDPPPVAVCRPIRVTDDVAASTVKRRPLYPEKAISPVNCAGLLDDPPQPMVERTSTRASARARTTVSTTVIAPVEVFKMRTYVLDRAASRSRPLPPSHRATRSLGC